MTIILTDHLVPHIERQLPTPAKNVPHIDRWFPHITKIIFIYFRSRKLMLKFYYLGQYGST